jgi:cystathionine beta-lyase/cystathionine gamma-synthase
LDNTKYIKDWVELKEVKSDTHTLEIDVESGSGWIKLKNGDAESWKNSHYLSTHTFYGSTFEFSTKLLQSCGFNVKLANWDEIGY